MREGEGGGRQLQSTLSSSEGFCPHPFFPLSLGERGEEKKTKLDWLVHCTHTQERFPHNTMFPPPHPSKKNIGEKGAVQSHFPPLPLSWKLSVNKKRSRLIDLRSAEREHFGGQKRGITIFFPSNNFLGVTSCAAATAEA